MVVCMAETHSLLIRLVWPHCSIDISAWLYKFARQKLFSVFFSLLNSHSTIFGAILILCRFRTFSMFCHFGFQPRECFFFTLTINSFHSSLFERLIIFASVYCPYLFILILFSFFIRCHTIHPIQDILLFVHAYLPFTDPSSSILQKCSLHFVVLIDFFSLCFSFQFHLLLCTPKGYTTIFDYSLYWSALISISLNKFSIE